MTKQRDGKRVAAKSKRRTQPSRRSRVQRRGEKAKPDYLQIRQRQSHHVVPDEVIEASEESFPASDPPAWTKTAATPSASNASS